jgi:hypothetical protein
MDQFALSTSTRRPRVTHLEDPTCREWISECRHPRQTSTRPVDEKPIVGLQDSFVCIA